MSDYEHYHNRVIVAGSRDFEDYNLVRETLDEFLADMPPSDTIIVSGAAKGADWLGEIYAGRYGYEVALFPADWDKHGKSAGYIRNKQMAEIATHLVAFWDGKSRGTAGMIAEASGRGIVIKVVQFERKP